MRRSFNAEIIKYNDEVAGIDFGADFCAEHEFGIKDINQAFGIMSDEIGIKRYTITKVPDAWSRLEKVCFTERKMPWVGLYFNSMAPFISKDIPLKKFVPHPYKFTEDELCTAWDSSSFGLVVHKKNEWLVDAIMEAIQNKDLAIGIASGHAFKNGGLKLLFVSKVPADILESIKEDHTDYANLMKAANKTKIKEYLKRHGKQYHALEPKWYDPEFKPRGRTLSTKYNVIFFLNPWGQDKYNSGWYTVEELKQWGKDKGIILK